MLRALLWGAIDTILFISLPITASVSSQAIWNARYQLTTAQQRQVELWASAAWQVAYMEDVPPVVPLVLWFKEGGLRAENPDNCEGIMGLHTAVTSGELPCFPKGDIGPRAILYQLQLGARTFKSYCPEISYTTIDPAIIKRCYLKYNAGPASRANPNESAYVMNGYNARYKNMVHTDAQGQSYPLTSLGAWPTHLAIQAQLAQRSHPAVPGVLLAPAMLMQEWIDRAWVKHEGIKPTSDVVLDPLDQDFTCRSPEVFDCFIMPSIDGNAALLPVGSPLLLGPVEHSALKCGLLPGATLVPPKTSIVLAPMPGELSRYTDGMGHLAVRIENEAWTVWITGLRSYTVAEGSVERGTPVGAVDGANTQGSGIHYAIYDRIKSGFVDSLSFVPADMCSPAN